MYRKASFDLVGNGGGLNTIEKDWRRLNPLQVKIPKPLFIFGSPLTAGALKVKTFF
jgi:hypothetical protein